ncbi:hypothetical protein BO221_18650 [Archangium sp. Cb G35]|uniref:hypothetical protein n=1 Tax=Archangium sp. Cb G35 TaxID=1920190 RepID=UPI00093661DB|nr:hypothetical protein [Archangium sp. Cb G35]OJT22921.1 hypothetical protein BO221_18650 [Archangium sp. Cb G35]
MKAIQVFGVMLLVLTGGCGPAEDTPTNPSEESTHTAAQAMEEGNGLAFNGLAFNGLAFNGLAFNGLAFNGLSSSSFSSWFQQHPAESNLFMKYLVHCSVPAGQTRTYSKGTATYVWRGGLGLAPGWSSGLPATLAEQQVVSACLAALVNKYGRTVQISVLGANAVGQRIPTTPVELGTFTLREACFFGNLFNGQGLFVGNDQGLLSASQSSLRACALSGPNACPPLVHVGSCHARCQHDGTGSYFTRCTYNGVTYQPLTTRLRYQDISTCGDGICQRPNESCGTGSRADSCMRDCGTCG